MWLKYACACGYQRRGHLFQVYDRIETPSSCVKDKSTAHSLHTFTIFVRTALFSALTLNFHQEVQTAQNGFTSWPQWTGVSVMSSLGSIKQQPPTPTVPSLMLFAFQPQELQQQHLHTLQFSPLFPHLHPLSLPLLFPEVVSDQWIHFSTYFLVWTGSWFIIFPNLTKACTCTFKSVVSLRLMSPVHVFTFFFFRI